MATECINRVLSGGQSQQMTWLSLTCWDCRATTHSDRPISNLDTFWANFIHAGGESHATYFLFVERLAVSGKLINHDNWAKTSDMDDVYDAHTLQRMSAIAFCLQLCCLLCYFLYFLFTSFLVERHMYIKTKVQISTRLLTTDSMKMYMVNGWSVTWWM